MSRISLLLLACVSTLCMTAQPSFEQYFYNKTLRVDFDLVGDTDNTEAFLSELIEEPFWGGRQNNLDNSIRLGDYLMVLKDSISQEVIYEEGFATLFEEWQATHEATQFARSFPNSVIMPYPKANATFYIVKRENNSFTDTIMAVPVISHGKEIIKKPVHAYDIDTIMINKPSHQAIDIVILGEGFTVDEMYKFEKESNELINTLLTANIFSKNKEKLNAYAIATPSMESGADHPTKDIWNNTFFNSSFNTLYSPRYLITKDIRKVRDIASLVPYDQIYILVNTERYGGGGIYNFYSICSAYGRANKQVLIHEFGHGFAALADEYYYDDNMLTDYIDLKTEPWQKNITTLVNLDEKWGNKLDKNTPVPTPAEDASKYEIGVYEGGGYVSKGVYRACPDCRMKTNTAPDFCPVCEDAIQEVIDMLTE